MNDLLADMFGANETWMTHPARPCAHGDADRYFPGDGNANPKTARALCHGCPVVNKCGTYAIERPDLAGIWGGLTEAERKRLRNEAVA